MVRRWLLPLVTALVLFFSPVFSFADNRGVSFIGLCSEHWPCRDSKRVFNGSEVINFGWLASTFGERCECAKELLRDARPKVVRVHVANGTCFPERGRRCGGYEVFAGESIRSADHKLRQRNRKLLRRFSRAAHRVKRQLSHATPPITVYVSPCLECPISSRARKVLLKRTARIFDGVNLVDNPMSGHCVEGVVCEKHGTGQPPGRPFITDLDGIDFQDVNACKFFERSKGGDLALLWARGFNLLPSTSRFIEPRERIDRPSRKLFQKARRLIRRCP